MISFPLHSDVTEELFPESPVLEKELDLPSEIKSHPREPEQSLPEPSVFSPQNQNGSTNDVVSDSPPEPIWSLSDTPKEVSKETKTSNTPKEVFKESKTSDTPKEVFKETKTSVVKSLDDAPRVSVTESSTMYASVSKPPFGFHSMNKKEQPNNEVINEIESIFFVGFQL